MPIKAYQKLVNQGLSQSACQSRLTIIANTPPQVGAWGFRTPNLWRRKSNCHFPKAFVKMSMSCMEVWTYLVWIAPFCISSRTKWQSTSICFVHSWKTGLVVMCKAAWLSQYKCIGSECITPRVDNNPFNHFNSQVVVSMDYIPLQPKNETPYVASWSSKRLANYPKE